MRIAIACGGTGGHFYPGYVLGKTLLARGREVLFVLRRDDPAGPRLEAEGLAFAELDLRGMPRRPSPELFSFAWRVGKSFLTARNVVRSWRPSAVAGMGGYLTFPLAAAARLAGVPVVLHESNAVLGLANRACARFASAVALGLPLAEPPPGLDTRLAGTPIRPELWKKGDPAAARSALGLDPEKPTLLVFGGSQGARGINRAAPRAAGLLARSGAPVQLLHLSGPKEEAEVRAAYAEAGFPGAKVLGYLSEMHLAYAASDLVLCRSGASTLAELAAQGKPALLVPYPSAADNHQEVNARALERAGAAEVLPERTMTPESLAAAARRLLDAPAARRAMSEAYSGLGLPAPERAAEAMADIVEGPAKRYLESSRS